MTRPDIESDKPLPETIHPDILSTAVDLVIRIEGNDSLLNPNSARRLNWRQRIVNGGEAIIEGLWRGNETDK